MSRASSEPPNRPANVMASLANRGEASGSESSMDALQALAKGHQAAAHQDDREQLQRKFAAQQCAGNSGQSEPRHAIGFAHAAAVLSGADDCFTEDANKWYQQQGGQRRAGPERVDRWQEQERREERDV